MRAMLILIALTFAVSAESQILNPVHLSYDVKKISDKRYELHIIANLDEGWHIYAQVQPKEAIAQPTQIKFNKNPLVTITGKLNEIGKKEQYKDAAAGIVQYQYADKVEFIQTFILKGKTSLSGTVTYQACTEERCLPPKTATFNVIIE